MIIYFNKMSDFEDIPTPKELVQNIHEIRCNTAAFDIMNILNGDQFHTEDKSNFVCYDLSKENYLKYQMYKCPIFKKLENKGYTIDFPDIYRPLYMKIKFPNLDNK
jgi:hypothetical protein